MSLQSVSCYSRALLVRHQNHLQHTMHCRTAASWQPLQGQAHCTSAPDPQLCLNSGAGIYSTIVRSATTCAWRPTYIAVSCPLFTFTHATRQVLAACRAAGYTIIHTREGHRPDLSDLSRNKQWRSKQIGRFENSNYCLNCMHRVPDLLCHMPSQPHWMLNDMFHHLLTASVCVLLQEPL